jgi:hypothetical protein
MARQTIEYSIQVPGRDFGKTFILTEAPATQSELWAMRAFLAITNSGGEIPDNVLALGPPGLLVAGIRAFAKVRYEDAEPLLAEMFSCVTARRMSPTVTRGIIEDDIEEPQTRLLLRLEIISLHVGFSIADAISTLRKTMTSADLSHI